MSDTSQEPVAAITEAEATGETARLYADIRSSLGVPVVNLIWRHFATLTGGLAWAWESVRPLYHDASIQAHAAALRHTMQLPQPEALSTGALRSAGLRREDLTTIAMILASYERTNAMNIIGLGALLAGIEGRSGTTDAGAASDKGAATYERAPALEGEMPRPLTLVEMPDDVREIVHQLHRLGPADEIVPTMYRHLSHWPGYLELINGLLSPMDRANLLAPAVQITRAASRARGATLAPGLATPRRVPNQATIAHIQERLAQFIDGPLAKMVTLVALIRASMAHAAS